MRAAGPGTAASGLLATLALLAALIAMVTQVIGTNVARALRTIVEDTRDAAFVIFAAVAGMAAGPAHLEVPLVGLAVITVACGLMLSPRATGSGVRPYWELRVRPGLGYTPAEPIAEPLGRSFDARHLVSAGSARQGAALDAACRVRLRYGADPIRVAAELNPPDGVQTYQMKRE